MSAWQPIETAPKDGTLILAHGTAYAELSEDGFRWLTADGNKPRKPFMAIIRWVEAWYGKEVPAGRGLYKKKRTLGYAYWGPHSHAFTPTHWQPLPKPPSPKQKGEK